MTLNVHAADFKATPRKTRPGDWGLTAPRSSGYTYRDGFASVKHTGYHSHGDEDWVAYRGTIAEPHLHCSEQDVRAHYVRLFGGFMDATENLRIVPMTDRHRAALALQTMATKLRPNRLITEVAA